MKVATDWSTSAEIQESRLQLPENRGTFHSQTLPLSLFEILLGHTLSFSRNKKSSKESGGKGIPLRYAKNILACVMIGIPTIGALFFVGDSIDEIVIHQVVALLYLLTLKICIGSYRKLHDLVDQIDLFDRSFFEIFAFAESPGKDFWWACLWFLLTLIMPVPFLVFLGSQVFNFYNMRSHLLSYFWISFHVVANVQRALVYVHFFAVGRAMRVRFRQIKGLLEEELQKSRPSAVNLENIRIHHARLSNLVDAMNNSVSKRLIFPILLIAAEFLYIFFRYIYRDNFTIPPLILVNLFTHLLVLKLVASGSEKIALESRMPLYVVRGVIISKLPFLCQAQILMFQDLILAVPVQISAGGFFYLDNKLLTELALLIVTYCTVILQLVPNEDDEDEKTGLDLANSTAANKTI